MVKLLHMAFLVVQKSSSTVPYWMMMVVPRPFARSLLLVVELESRKARHDGDVFIKPKLFPCRRNWRSQPMHQGSDISPM